MKKVHRFISLARNFGEDALESHNSDLCNYSSESKNNRVKVRKSISA
ncbi:MAG TPA: hypothetical protein PLA73_03030 [Sedimentibacter sp.]|nr:hypothetical protein [Sedimentibacter sp.]